MPRSAPVPLVVVGSVALDTIATTQARRTDVLGGSVSYACTAASFFRRPGLVGVVGDDFPAEHVRRLERFGVDVRGLQRKPGKTFRWSGVYEADMNQRRTLSTELNVFADFWPELPPDYRASPFLFLANIEPRLQSHVLDQVRKPKFVAADTMNLWIHTAREDLLAVIRRVHLLLVNDEEARLLSGKAGLWEAAQSILKMGPRFLIIKRGEHGSVLASRTGRFLLPAFPVDDVRDPTGAGDCFAGGLMGFLARAGKADESAVRRAMVHGTVMASFCVEDFSLDRFQGLKAVQVAARHAAFCRMIRA
jgi:sugar/nucleoside kinase (ribokinase family)